ncbi:hypothetical protein B0T18DRAFT_393059 [Schizothecium vesticola]|uniref:Uncharacterized protein n=1 Tax=Schizothecium vesticola TaxID=314040 RepID=A0AA40EIY5_9PEZI|nr:hypothetical protein B0T18DRAFT_393059 [Schizothecium vesticola]
MSLPPLWLFVLKMALILKMATADSEPKNVAKFLNSASRLGGRRSGDERAVIAVAAALSRALECGSRLQQRLIVVGTVAAKEAALTPDAGQMSGPRRGWILTGRQRADCIDELSWNRATIDMGWWRGGEVLAQLCALDCAWERADFVHTLRIPELSVDGSDAGQLAAGVDFVDRVWLLSSLGTVGRASAPTGVVFDGATG